MHKDTCIWSLGSVVDVDIDGPSSSVTFRYEVNGRVWPATRHNASKQLAASKCSVEVIPFAARGV
jgi:hypothetical protein